ncbi:EAL domain-containing protein [Sulfurimonas sp. HSL-3221]|uniref:EAL domain-containing protein n=1 Tax=Sulfurimonas diazotrophicus TaxID=3131939 RepID=A0ABZ3HCF3_9BACT|nr:EAL domain-containing protein [Sulfurimonas sp. HSL-3221]UFS62785.1 EAL domain-containing protein [Sulfurimonas sp. HSL-3221]
MKLTIWNSLASKLLFSLAFFSLLLVFGLAYVNTKIVISGYKKQLQELVEQKIDFMLPQLSDALHNDKQLLVEEQLIRLSSAQVINGVRLLRNHGRPLVVGNFGSSHRLFTLALPVTNINGEIIASMDVAVSDRNFRSMMEQYFQFLAAIIAGYVLLVLLLLRLLYRSFLPLRELTRKLEAFDPSHPVPIELRDTSANEIGMIAEAANKMSDNIIHHADFMNELHKEIEEGRQHLKEAQQIARMGSWRIDTQTHDCSFSDQMYVLLGLPMDGMPLTWEALLNVIEPSQRQAFIRALENTAQTHTPFRLMHKLVNAHGEAMHVLTEGKLSLRRDGKAFISGITMDVSEQAESQQMIEKLAFYDPLTNLPNRVLMQDRLQKAIKDANRRGEKLGVLFLDLDGFKNVNDTLGHTLGDRLLKEVAERLKRTLRDSDTISRIGGDEFIVLLPLINSEKDITIVAKKMIDALQERWEFGDKAIFTTTSIGVAIYPDHSDDADTLIKFADTAMYKAKEDGRNRYRFYDTTMGETIRKKLQVEHEMREAIETMEQFELYYQPKISLRTGAITGAEALIRWNHPKIGTVYPDDFIPVAEHTGMIIKIGEWVMHEAARRIEQWRASGIVPLKLAVNLSGRQFGSPLLLHQIRTVLQRYDIKPEYLEFEVTESVSMISLTESLKVLHQLRDLGVGVNIDDFGTGYSSLAYLKQFPVDTLKIDKAFIMNMLDDQDDRTIVESIVSLSKAMGLKIVAEGVESIEHVRLLKKLGVDYGQGYFFSKPVPFGQLDRMYRNNLVKMKTLRESERREAV